MIAVFVNCAAILVGSFLGLILSSRFNEKMEDVVRTGAGIITLVLGFQMAFKFQNVIYFTLAVILGGIVGTLFDLDGKIFAAGKFLEKALYKNKNSSSPKNNFAYAFLNSSVLFCVGAMAIVGSLKAGIEKDYSIIFTKSILDGFMAISFAAAMGCGTAFSVLAVLLYQGTLTLLSEFLSPYCSEQMITELTGSGGALIVMIGINLLKIRSIKTANYLPAILFSVVFVCLDPIFKGLLGR